MSNRLTIERLSASYSGVLVLSGVSFAAQGGELTALLGRNGSGKTTLLRVLAGVLPASSGLAGLAGLELTKAGRTRLADQAAYVPQLAAPPPYLRVIDAVRLCARNGRAASEAVDLLSLASLADKRCDQVSGGEWRRVLVAQGLAQLPQHGGLLLLDEPLAYVDAQGRCELLRTLREAAGLRNAVLMLAMHEIELGAEYCSRAVYLREGRVMGEGDYSTVARLALRDGRALPAEAA